MREVADHHLERAIPGIVPHRRLEGPVAIALQYIHEGWCDGHDEVERSVAVEIARRDIAGVKADDDLT